MTREFTERQRRFIEAYDGNAAEAARIAGYANARQQGQRLLTKADIREAIEKREEKPRKLRIATREERQAFWTKVMEDEDVSMRDRLKASELLGKSQADFIDRHEHTGRDGGPIEVSSARLRLQEMAARVRAGSD